MGFWGVVLLLAGAIVLGVIGRFIGKRRYSYEWLLYAIGAAIGGWIASEYLGGASTWGWEADGLFVFPALIGAIVIGGAVELVVRLTGRAPAQAA